MLKIMLIYKLYCNYTKCTNYASLFYWKNALIIIKKKKKAGRIDYNKDKRMDV